MTAFLICSGIVAVGLMIVPVFQIWSDNKRQQNVRSTCGRFLFLRRAPKAVRYAQSRVLFVVQSAETGIFSCFSEIAMIFAKKGVLLYSHSKGNTPKTKNQKTFEKTKCLQRSCKEGCVKIRSQQRKTTKKEKSYENHEHKKASRKERNRRYSCINYFIYDINNIKIFFD